VNRIRVARKDECYTDRGRRVAKQPALNICSWPLSAVRLEASRRAPVAASNYCIKGASRRIEDIERRNGIDAGDAYEAICVCVLVGNELTTSAHERGQFHVCTASLT
jgi:hypothetical protein